MQKILGSQTLETAMPLHVELQEVGCSVMCEQEASQGGRSDGPGAQQPRDLTKGYNCSETKTKS